MSNTWVKTIQQPAGFYLNSGTGDATVGGTISSVPSGITVNQGRADKPGDRMILHESDALALSDVTNVGTLYGGMYQYVTAKATATGTATRGRAVFWDVDSTGYQYLYQVTPDENGTMGVIPFAGVVITPTIGAGYSWWIQTAGRVFVRFKASLTGTAAIGQGIFLAGAGAGADLGRFDTQGGVSTAITYANFGTYAASFVGWAYELPVADGLLTTIGIPLGRSLAFRW